MKSLRTAGLGAGMLAAVATAGVLLHDVTPPADRWLAGHAAGPGSPAAAAATAISGAGTVLALAALTAAAVAAGRRRGPGHLLRVLATILVAASVLLLQHVFLRPGPPQQPQAGTYPSGHVAVLTAIAFGVVLLSRELGRTWHRAALAGAAAAVVLVAASRILLAEHWLLDTAAAVVAAAGAGLLAAALLRVRTPSAEPA